MSVWTQRRWFYPLIYFLLVFIAFLPVITEKPYDPRDVQKVIFEILSRATLPYAAWGWVFHLGTLAVITLAIIRSSLGGRAIAMYFGLNHFVIAATQTHAQTPTYGYAIQIGALLAEVLLGGLWLWVAWQNRLRISFQDVPRWRWTLLPLALLTFWAPVSVEGTRVAPNFDPLLLLTSPDYGFAYCLMTPVFLFLLILAWPHVNQFAFRVTAFNALLYGLFNLGNWSHPDSYWMGVMHIPLLVLGIVALWLAHQPSSPTRPN